MKRGRHIQCRHLRQNVIVPDSQSCLRQFLCYGSDIRMLCQGFQNRIVPPDVHLLIEGPIRIPRHRLQQIHRDLAES
ncbi:MAG: hypothetical protein CME13_01725 [Gemmatimonadetes bacterium]|nr:hypothetical protein [Gemmatimonadota bacterium]